MANIAVISIGHHQNRIIENFLAMDAETTHLDFILFNMLDYSLPPKIKNSSVQKYMDELRHFLNLLGSKEHANVSESLIALLKENDRLNLSNDDLALLSHISMIDLNSNSLDTTYDILLAETKYKNVSLTPLSEEIPQLEIYKGKKYAPVRYFVLSGELLDEPETDKKKKHSDKKYVIENVDTLKSIKFNEKVENILDRADLIVLVASDYTSLGTLMSSKEMMNQFKKIETPFAYAWTLPDEVSNEEKIISESIGFGLSLKEFGKSLAELSDYVILDRSKMEDVEYLRGKDCKVFVEDLWDENGQFSEKAFKAVLSVGGITQNESKVPVEEIPEDVEGNAKPISDLLESQEEKDDLTIKDEEITDIPENNSSVEEETVTEEEVHQETVSEPETKSSFTIQEEEEWFDSAKRAIELSMEDPDNEAFQWLLEQSQDSEKELQIAESLTEYWINSRSITLRKVGAELIAKLVPQHALVYQQILQREMMESVAERTDDRRRQLILLYHILYDADTKFTQDLISGIIREFASLPEKTSSLVIETAKLTILQLVISRKKLTVLAIRVILDVLDKKHGSNAELWNILTSFDATTVAIEIVTKFSSSKLDEITRKSSILRFTGSYYVIISEVIKAWKDGDKVSLSNAVGTILPEPTVRKFERMELARSVEKLKMVQLSALAETLDKDVKNVEQLVTELIVKGELNAEFKYIDDKMFVSLTKEGNP